MDELAELRKEIDSIDNELLIALAKRLKVIRKITKVKRKHKIKPEDPKREADILEHLIKKGRKLGIEDKLIKKVWRRLFRMAYKIESQ